jgi:hypothetical protein
MKQKFIIKKLIYFTMKNKIINLLYIGTLLFTLIIPGNAQSQASLTGKIIDKNTGEPLIGVTVYLVNLKSGTITDIDGKYKIEHLPNKKVNHHQFYLPA